MRSLIAIHAPGVLRSGDRRSRRSHRAGAVHIRNALLKIARDFAWALSLQDPARHRSSDLLLSPPQVNPAL